MTEYDSDRAFQLWEYRVSHGCALVRSPRGVDHAANVDVMLWGVEYLALPRHLNGVTIEVGTPAEAARVAEMIDREVPAEWVWILVSGGVRHLVVASTLEVRESDMDIFDSPFKGPFDHA